MHTGFLPKARFKRSALKVGKIKLLQLRDRRFPNREFGRQIDGVIKA